MGAWRESSQPRLVDVRYTDPHTSCCHTYSTLSLPPAEHPAVRCLLTARLTRVCFTPKRPAIAERCRRTRQRSHRAQKGWLRQQNRADPLREPRLRDPHHTCWQELGRRRQLHYLYNSNRRKDFCRRTEVKFYSRQCRILRFDDGIQTFTSSVRHSLGYTRPSSFLPFPRSTRLQIMPQNPRRRRRIRASSSFASACWQSS